MTLFSTTSFCSPVEEIQLESQMVLDAHTERDFQDLQERWKQSITAQGDFFEEVDSRIKIRYSFLLFCSSRL